MHLQATPSYKGCNSCPAVVGEYSGLKYMSDESRDIRIVALKCPNCGGALQVSPGSDHTQCEHCGSTVLIVDARTGETRIDTIEPETPEAAAARRRVIKIVLWGTAISFGLPIITTVLVTIIIAVVFLVLGIVLFGVAR